jgi:hypothetical protein
LGGGVMAEVTSGDVTVIVLGRREADVLADMVDRLIEVCDDDGGLPASWQALIDEMGMF